MKRISMGVALLVVGTAFGMDLITFSPTALERLTAAQQLKLYIKRQEKSALLNSSGAEIIEQNPIKSSIRKSVETMIGTSGTNDPEEGFVRAVEVGAVFKALSYLSINYHDDDFVKMMQEFCKANTDKN